jgi:hypothetical protein
MKTKTKVLSALSLLMVAIPFAVVGSTEVGKDATTLSTYRWPAYLKQSPIEIVEMKLDQQKISSDVSFATSDDWLRRLSVKVRNVSKKNVKLIRLSIEFQRDTRGNSTLPNINITGGQMFHFSPQFARSGEDLTLLPAKTMDLKASQEGCNGLPADNKWMTDPAAKRATVSVEMVLFDDDTGWINGNPVVRDKHNLSRWVRAKNWAAELTANLRKFAGLRSNRILAHHVDEEGSCYMWDSASTGSCGPPSSGCFQVVYNLTKGQSGFNRKDRTVECVGCGVNSSTKDTDSESFCGLLQ